MTHSNLLTNTLAAIDTANKAAPNSEIVDGSEISKELIYGQRMSLELDLFEPEASEHLQIAARAQHIERWKSPRTDYPEGRSGYKNGALSSQLSALSSQLSALSSHYFTPNAQAKSFYRRAIVKTISTR